MFKIGDKVRCIDISGLTGKKLNFKKIYTVKDCDRNLVTVSFEDDELVVAWVKRFLLVERAKSEPTKKILTLPTDSEARKEVPILSGCINYFPAALAGVARISKAGNDKHNPGQELHHDRTKSLDHADCIGRHLIDLQSFIAALNRGEIQSYEQILAEASSLAWRALAYSQTLHEKYDGAPMAPGARINK